MLITLEGLLIRQPAVEFNDDNSSIFANSNLIKKLNNR